MVLFISPRPVPIWKFDTREFIKRLDLENDVSFSTTTGAAGCTTLKLVRIPPIGALLYLTAPC